MKWLYSHRLKKLRGIFYRRWKLQVTKKKLLMEAELHKKQRNSEKEKNAKSLSLSI